MKGSVFNISAVKGKKSAGIHIHFLPGEDCLIHLMVLKKQKQLVLCESQKSFSGSVHDIPGMLPKNIPLHIAFTGQSVLHKKTQSGATGDLEREMQNNIPGAKPADLVYQFSAAAEGTGYISVIRKESIQEVLESINKSKLFINDISLGPFSIHYLTVQGLAEVNGFTFEDFSVSFKNRLISDISPADKKSRDIPFIMVGDDKISHKYILAYASAFLFFLPGDNQRLIVTRGIHCQPERYYLERMSNIAGLFFIILLFSVLLINFMLYSRYDNRLANLNLRYNTNKNLIQKLDKLEHESQKKRQFLVKSGFLSKSRLSYFADRIAYLIPENTNLTELSLQPPLKKPEQGEQFNIRKDMILIKGNTSRINEVNQWIKTIKSEPWVEHIESFEMIRPENKKSKTQFSILLQYKSTE